MTFRQRREETAASDQRANKKGSYLLIRLRVYKACFANRFWQSNMKLQPVILLAIFAQLVILDSSIFSLPNDSAYSIYQLVKKGYTEKTCREILTSNKCDIDIKRVRKIK